jgi:RNA polymerase sigma-70 factor (ECF subfamily)
MANVPLLSLRTDGERLAWTFTVAKNITFDTLRAQRREFAYERENFDLEIESTLLQEPTIDSKLEGLLQGISPEMREVLQMKFELGMNSREIAKKLSTPEGTVRRRIQIGLSKIKNNIRE